MKFICVYVCYQKKQQKMYENRLQTRIQVFYPRKLFLKA